jgi:hypothetical protein
LGLAEFDREIVALLHQMQLATTWDICRVDPFDGRLPYLSRVAQGAAFTGTITAASLGLFSIAAARLRAAV